MLRRRPALLALWLAALPAPPARAFEFTEGVRAYEARSFARARGIFLELATLGDGASQYNLGAMSLRGDGAPKDRGEAAGWMQAARENGHDPTPAALDALLAGLGPAERETADRVLARFGRTALEATVLPPRNPGARGEGFEPPQLLEGADPEPPEEAAGTQGLVAVRFVLGADGRPRDAEMVASFPAASEGGGPFVREALRSVLRRRYAPARRDGAPIPVFLTTRVALRRPGAAPVEDYAERRLQPAAEGGDARAQLALGLLRLLAGGGDEAGAWGLVLSAAHAGVPEAQLLVARSLTGEPARALPWLAAAARTGLPSALAAYAETLAGQGAPAQTVRELLATAAGKDDAFAVRHALSVLACSTDPALRDREKALEAARRARLDTLADPLTEEALAAGHAVGGSFAAARRVQRAAVERARQLGWAVGPMERRLAAYDRGLACDQDFLTRPAAAVPLGAGEPPRQAPPAPTSGGAGRGG